MFKISKEKVLVVTAILLVGGMAVYVNRLKKENKVLGQQIEAFKQDPQSINREEIKKLTEVLAKLVVLPEGEEPVVATVTDKEKLKDQPVFAKAENGDKIVIYGKAKKAYIYSPSKNILVDVVPVNIGDSNITITGVNKDNPLKIALVNGSKNEGITAELEKRINDRGIAGLSVVSKAAAKSDAYEKTVVYDISGKLGQQAREIAALVGGEVVVETTEGKPNADIMIIVGADFK